VEKTLEHIETKSSDDQVITPNSTLQLEGK